jgi:ABC-type lipopolysaccharide export system ATPase subunit
VRQTLEIADRVYVLAHGQLQASGRPEQLRATLDLAGVYLGQAPRAAGSPPEARPGGGR